MTLNGRRHEKAVLLPGVRPWGNGFQVRIRWATGRRIEETLPTAEAANARLLQLRAAREAGVAPEMMVGTSVGAELTLAEACAALLTRKRATVSRKTKRPLREGGIEWWERVTKPWRTGRYARVPLSMLRRTALEDDVLARAAMHPKSAGDELYGLKAVLRYAGQRGSAYEHSILLIEPVARTRRTRRALTAAQLQLLAAHAPDYAHRELLFLGTVGCRINEIHTLTHDRVDLRERTIFIPWNLCKEGRDKIIDLTTHECTILREQLMARAVGTDLVFPSKTGKSWSGKSKYGDWHRLVWSKAVRRASAEWRRQYGLGDAAPTPFEAQVADSDGEPRFDDRGLPQLDALEPHDLRATAATLMRDAGFTREQVAARLGHADSGELLDRVYDVGDRRKRAAVREAIDTLVPEGLIAGT